MADTARYLTLDQVAEIVGGRTTGRDTVRIRGIAPLRDAGPDQIGLLAEARYLKDLEQSDAGAILVSEDVLDGLPEKAPPRVVVRDARAALPALLDALHPDPPVEAGIHPTAVIGKGVLLGANATVGPYAVIASGCNIGDRVRIGAHVVLGPGCRVGEASVLHPHVVLYHGTILGRRVLVHSGTRIGADGFGFTVVDGAYRKIPQVGRVVIEDDVEIGANSCIDRGSIGDTVIGKGSKLDNLVHLAHNVRVGEGVAFAAQTGIAGSTRVGARSVFGGQAGAVGHIEIGEGAKIAGQAGVIGNVPPGARVTGYPARDVKSVMKATAHLRKLPELAARVRAIEEQVGAVTKPNDSRSDAESDHSGE